MSATEVRLGKSFFRPTAHHVQTAEAEAHDNEVMDKLSKKMEKDKKEAEEKALYKIEVAFSWDRTASSPSNALVQIWESGRRFHGGGDERMFWCGYKDCDKPIKSEMVKGEVAFCPHCKRPMFVSQEDKERTVGQAKMQGIPHSKLAERPIVVEIRFAKLMPSKLAVLLEKIWRDLDCNADLYVKFFKSKMRFDPKDGDYMATVTQARLNREYAIYPLKNILKDTLSGASVQKRFLAFLMS